MIKKSIKFVIASSVLLVFIFGYFLYAKDKRMWPFGSSISYMIPNSAKSLIYGFIQDKNKEIETYFYNLELSYYQIPNNNYLTTGGSIKQINTEKILYVSENGEIYLFDINKKKFFKNKNHFNEFNNVRDIEIDKSKKKFYIVAVKKDGKNCGSINLIKYDYDLIKNSINFYNKKTLWESEKNCSFKSKLSGARVLKVKENFYVSTGIFVDPSYSGIIPENFSQDIKSSFGKIIKINNKESTIFATGFRNPQGLFNIKNTEIIFGTDHGPNGGDEVNYISKFHNYGWPCISYGKLYSKFSDEYNKGRDFPHIKKLNNDVIYPTLKELEDFCDQNKFYSEPIYTFSREKIGISQGIHYDNDYFNQFKDNIIVSSLAGRTLFRFVLNQNKNEIISSEQIYIGNRIRDLEVTNDGKLLALTDNGFLIYIENSNKALSDFKPN